MDENRPLSKIVEKLDAEVKERVGKTANRESANREELTASFKIDGVPFVVQFERGEFADSASFEDFQRAVEKLRAATQGIAVWD